MVKILVISRQGDGLDFAIDAKRWGHEALCWVQDPKYKGQVLEGLVDKVDDYMKVAKECDYAFFDTNGLTEEWEKLSKVIPCFGGSPQGQKMEKDRAFAHKLMADAGMKHFESVSFKTIEEAIKHLQDHRVQHVAKIVGGDAESDDVLISEREDGADAIALMQRFLDDGKKYDAVEVEERVFGVEVGCAGYFNGRDWVGPIEINFQHKEICSGRPGSARGLGPLCGETGTVIKYVGRENSFFKKSLDLFTEHLRKIDYRGEIDIGTITNEDGIFPIEFTPRKGYPDMFIRRALTKSPEPDLYAACAKGQDFDYQVMPGWAVGFLVMVPGFPYPEAVKDHAAGYPVFGFDEKNPSMHALDFKKGKRGLEICQGYGYVAVVTGRGSTIESAARNAYWWVHPANEKRLYIPKAWVRSDIGDRVVAQREQVLELGVMTEQEWEGEAVKA